MDEAGHNIVVVGLGETAEMALEYFASDSPHHVVAFSADDEYVTDARFMGLPVIPFSQLPDAYPSHTHRVFVAISSTQLNRARTRLFLATKSLGYSFASYISSRAFVSESASIGENAFILENNVIQHRVTIGDDVVIWSGNHIGHQSVIGDHSFISSHVVISGFCTIGVSTFFGVNSCVADGLTIGDDVVVGMGSVVTRNLPSGLIYAGNPARSTGRDALKSFGAVES